MDQAPTWNPLEEFLSKLKTEFSPAKKQDSMDDFLEELEALEKTFMRMTGQDSVTESQRSTIFLNLLRQKFYLDPIPHSVGNKGAMAISKRRTSRGSS